MSKLSLTQFMDMDAAPDIAPYVAILEAIDIVPQLQELKAFARQAAAIENGCRVLDVGCGIGLETEHLAQIVGPAGAVVGVDRSEEFLALARRRAAPLALADLKVDYRAGDAAALPFEDAAFDRVRSERLLVYVPDPEATVREFVRVLKPGGRIAMIEPDFTTVTVNASDNAVVRRVMQFEADTAVVTSRLPGRLNAVLLDLGMEDIRIETRVLIFPQTLSLHYFPGIADRAAASGVITEAAARTWRDEIEALAAAGRLFGHVGYFAFVATKPG